jgi:uncharacterized membrane protein YccC
MRFGQDYLTEIQSFTTSQYWNSGVRITTGVMIPMLIMVNRGWLSDGIPFLWGALFVSLTDSPGPIHHRRNGMLAGIVLNSLTVLISGFLYQFEAFLLIQVLAFSFFFSLFGVYGTRAGAVGALALVVMLLNMSPFRDTNDYVVNAMLTAGGGIWYASFSMLLFRLQPYRLVEQALGENLRQIADYMRARAAFYKKGADIDAPFNVVMQEQIAVLKSQNQLRELIFKTRQFVGDASPKSRSIMMVFLESILLFEETMHTYQDYKLLHQHTRHTTLLEKFYSIIIQLSSELEYIGLSVQSGNAVRRIPDFAPNLEELSQAIQEQQLNSYGKAVNESLRALEQTVENLRSIANRLANLVLYTQLQIDINPTLQDQEMEERSSLPQTSKPIHVSLLIENFTFRSNNFKFAVRLTVAMLAGYAVSSMLSVSHTYWVLLTILTIVKPVYNVTRRRNIQRVLGTLAGVLAASTVLFLVSDTTALLVLLVVCMLMAYSLLRVNYLGFVIFLTIYIVITFHFLHPVEYQSLIGERLIDTFIGSVVAALAARFIFPVWEHENIKGAMEEAIETNRAYFLAAWDQLTGTPGDESEYNKARSDAIVALTNLSDNFQQMLVEPGQGKTSSHVHQFVIASHALTSRIAALSSSLKTLPGESLLAEKQMILDALDDSITNLQISVKAEKAALPDGPKVQKMNPLSIIHSLARDLRAVTLQIAISKE